MGLTDEDIRNYISVLGSGDESLVSLYAGLLGAEGPRAKDAVPALRALLSSGSYRVQEAARDALNKIER